MPSYTINDIALQPERLISQTPEHFGLRAVDIETRNAAGHAIRGWLILPPVESVTPPSPAALRGLVLVSHGNAGNVGTFLPWAKVLADHGHAVALYDYQGFGQSEGKADVASMAADAMAVVEWLRTKPEIGDSRSEIRNLFLLGLSLGTLVSIWLAGQLPCVRAAALEGATIAEDLFRRMFGDLGAAIAWSLSQQVPPELDTARQVPHARCPLLFLHSPDDEVTHVEIARKLFDLAPPDKQWLDVPGRHLAAVADWPDYGRKLCEFFDAFAR